MQGHHDCLQIEINKSPEIVLRKGVSQPEDSLKQQAAILPPPKAAYTVPTPSGVQPPPPKVAYTATTPSLEGSNSKDRIIPLPPRVNKGTEPHSETHKLQEMEGQQKVLKLPEIDKVGKIEIENEEGVKTYKPTRSWTKQGDNS